MSIVSSRPSTVGWFEITATEPADCVAFYQDLFEWTFEPHGGRDYYTITAPDAAEPMGSLRGGVQDSLSVDVVCSDAAATVRALESLGISVAEAPHRTPAGDVHAVVTEVRGNRLGLFEPATQLDPATHAAPVPNAVAWFEIGTTDLVATQSFYRKAFGWTTERDDAVEEVDYYGILPPGSTEQIGGVVNLSGSAGMAEYAIPGLRVADVAKVLERCEERGGRRVMGPFTDANDLVIGQFVDPAGNRWSAFSAPSAA